MNSESTPIIRALSIRQPWAWLITNGPKDIENRSWFTKFRGPVLIHAGQRFDQDCYYYLSIMFPDLVIPTNPIDFECGGIVGQATITDCVRLSDSPWFSGPHGFLLVDRKPLPFRPCKG